MKHHLLLGTFAICIAASPALADGGNNATAVQTQTTQAAEAASDEAERLMSAGSPNSRAAAGFSASSLQFSTEQGDTSVSMAFSLDVGSRGPNRSNTPYHKVSRSRLNIVLSVPVDGEGEASNLFAGDSLVSGSTAKLGFTRFSTSLGDGTGARNMRGPAYKACVRDRSAIWVTRQSDRAAAQAKADAFLPKVLQQLDKADNSLNASGSDLVTYRSAIRVPAEDAGALGEFVKAGCVADGSSDTAIFGSELELLDEYGLDPAAFRREFFPEGAKVTFWGIDASIGRDDHEYLDRTAFKLNSAPRTSWEFGAFYGWMNTDLTFSLRGRAVYGQSYKDQDEAEICRTVSIPAGDECIKGPDGEPLRQRSGLISVEARKLVTVREGTQIALAPQVTYRFEDKNLGIEVPIYLSPDKDGKLTGGIKAVYNSKGDEFAVGLFVGVPFSIFYN